jgi:hypothetical protein
MWCGSSAISSVGASAQRRPVRREAGGDRLIGHGQPVAIARLGAGGVGPVGLEVDAVASGVGRPLTADVRGRRHDHHDARRAPR